MKITDPVSLNDTVWTTSHVASFLGQNPDSILTVVNSADFPKPLTNQQRNRRWLGEDVKEYFVRRSQGLVTEPSKARVDVTQAPKSMRLKG
jgi:predicted DNA-binding transcriptional regulator AlpA